MKELLLIIPLLLSVAMSAAASGESVTVYKDPNCGCCVAGVEHLRRAGFQVSVVDSDDMAKVKAKLGVPDEMQSCHAGVADTTGK
jgi:hypothetical protein